MSGSVSYLNETYFQTLFLHLKGYGPTSDEFDEVPHGLHHYKVELYLKLNRVNFSITF